MDNKWLILLIEDEPQMARFLRVILLGQGYRLAEARTGAEGLNKAATEKPDVILLDLGLPDMDGIEVARELRSWNNSPVIVLSAREQEMDKVKALDAGADDYLTKPFGAKELLARIRVALRHRSAEQSGEKEPVFSAGDLMVNLLKREVFVAGKEVHLTPIEYKLLAVLIRNAGKVVTHSQLLKEAWGPSYMQETQYVRVYMAQLRHKIEANPAWPKLLINEPGVGYRLRTDFEEEGSE